MVAPYVLPRIPEVNRENVNVEEANVVNTRITKQGIIDQSSVILRTKGRTAAIRYLLDKGLVAEALTLMNRTGMDIGTIAQGLVKDSRTLDAARIIIESGRPVSAAIKYLENLRLIDAARGVVIDTVLRKRTTDKTPLDVRDTNGLLVRYGISEAYIEAKREEVRGLMWEGKTNKDLTLLLQKHGLVTEKRQLVMSVARIMKDKGARPDVIKSFLESYGIESESVNVVRPKLAEPPVVAAEPAHPAIADIAASSAPALNASTVIGTTVAARPSIADIAASSASTVTNASSISVAPTDGTVGDGVLIEEPQYKSHQNVLSALNAGIDPNTVYDRSATNIKTTLGPRDKARGWFGPKQSKSAYKVYIRKTLENLRTPEQIVNKIGELLAQPKPSASAIYKQFDIWRKVINRGGVDAQLLISIDKVGAPGWFGASKNYIPNIVNLIQHYNEGLPFVPASRPTKNAWKIRGYTRKAPVPAPAHVPAPLNDYAPVLNNTTPSFLRPGYIGTVKIGDSPETSVFAGIGGARHTRKIATSRRMARRHKHRTSRRRTVRRQHGGATPMPLAYYQPGAYETRTLEATGAGIAGSTAAWVREPVMQAGGRRRTHRRQAGGFSPSVMGQFASAGLRLLPVAGYMGYKMFNKSRKAGRKSGRRTRRR